MCHMPPRSGVAMHHKSYQFQTSTVTPESRISSHRRFLRALFSRFQNCIATNGTRLVCGKFGAQQLNLLSNLAVSGFDVRALLRRDTANCARWLLMAQFYGCKRHSQHVSDTNSEVSMQTFQTLCFCQLGNK